MPTFPKPTLPVPTALINFNINAAVSEDAQGVQTVALTFSVQRVANLALASLFPSAIDTISGDLTPYLTAAQVTNFTNAALALYAKAKAELIG